MLQSCPSGLLVVGQVVLLDELDQFLSIFVRRHYLMSQKWSLLEMVSRSVLLVLDKLLAIRSINE